MSPASATHLPVYQPQTPFHMVWLATNACNARCVHCSSDALRCRPAELTTEEARKMLSDLREMGVLDLVVSGGEPLLRKDLFELIAYATQIGLRVGLGSNGSTITESVAQRLRAVGLDRLQISIDGTEKIHDLARRWRGLFSRSVRAIEIGIRNGLHLHVCFTVHRLNRGELRRVVELCRQLGVRRFNCSRFVPTGRGDSELDLSVDEWRGVAEEVEQLRREHAGHLEFSTHLAQLVLLDPAAACLPGFAGCQAGAGQGCIGPEGEVMPCVLLPIVAGNLKERPLREIWENSPVLRELRDRSLLKGYCHDCDVRDKCGGCRAVAFAYTGDCLAADPRCWRGLSHHPAA